jgi:hypothetical protein
MPNILVQSLIREIKRNKGTKENNWHTAEDMYKYIIGS